MIVYGVVALGRSKYGPVTLVACCNVNDWAVGHEMVGVAPLLSNKTVGCSEGTISPVGRIRAYGLWPALEKNRMSDS